MCGTDWNGLDGVNWTSLRPSQPCLSSLWAAPPAAYLSSEAQSLLKALLQKEAPKRLGFGPNGSKDVMGHAFFKGVNWKKLEARQVGGSSPGCGRRQAPLSVGVSRQAGHG